MSTSLPMWTIGTASALNGLLRSELTYVGTMWELWQRLELPKLVGEIIGVAHDKQTSDFGLQTSQICSRR